MTITLPDEDTAIQARTVQEWRGWLEENSAQAGDTWLVLQHVTSPRPSVRIHEAIFEVLCFGWVDSLARKRDGTSFYLRFTPRRPASRWSRRNREQAELMIANGRMTESGLAAINRAKLRGTWPTD